MIRQKLRRHLRPRHRVGWVECTETHHADVKAMGFAVAQPIYDQREMSPQYRRNALALFRAVGYHIRA
jgi:hypothetical protein